MTSYFFIRFRLVFWPCLQSGNDISSTTIIFLDSISLEAGLFLRKIHYLFKKLHINTLIVVAGYKVWLHLIFFCWKSELRKIISSKTRHINLKYLEINGNFDIEFVILQKRKELVVWRLSEKCVSADHCPSWFLWRVKIYCVFES